MSAAEFINLQEALIYVFGPILTVVTALVLSGGLLTALLTLGIELVTHRRRKTPTL